jgi:GAF domain-containing protein
MTLDPEAADRVLAAVARRVAAADRLTPDDDDGQLVALAAIAVTGLEAQAASIALYDATVDRLVFRAASGPAAGDIVGLSIEPAVGIAGYAFSSGQPLAVADVSTDPRFERSVAEASGYVPSSLLAVPIVGTEASLGVLEALDGLRGTFSMRDIDVATAIAAAIAAAVQRQRIGHDATTLLAAALRGLASGDGGSDDATIEALVASATADLTGDGDGDLTWQLADRIARLRDVDPDSIDLAVDWLDALLRRRGGTTRLGTEATRPR